jgi:NADP-dependent 3-hydroxy acid dehydrogenase YdfG
MATHLITGAGSGIGAAVTGRLSERGDELVLVARNRARGEDLVAQFPGSRALVVDLANPAGIGVAIRDQGVPERLDSVLHAAGVVELGPVGEMAAELWSETITVNLLAPAELTRAVLPALRAARGQVVFVNSGSGLRTNPGWAAYAASKHGLRALAEALRGEEQAHGVRVTSVYPGRTATAMQAKVHEQEGKEYDPSEWIDPGSVATTILAALDLPRDAEITDLTVRPAPR